LLDARKQSSDLLLGEVELIDQTPDEEGLDDPADPLLGDRRHLREDRDRQEHRQRPATHHGACGRGSRRGSAFSAPSPDCQIWTASSRCGINARIESVMYGATSAAGDGAVGGSGGRRTTEEMAKTSAAAAVAAAGTSDGGVRNQRRSRPPTVTGSRIRSSNRSMKSGQKPSGGAGSGAARRTAPRRGGGGGARRVVTSRSASPPPRHCTRLPRSIPSPAARAVSAGPRTSS